jgi:DNA polymerase-3 subunit epsilon/ATP-dependent DNA helicase DinG
MDRTFIAIDVETTGLEPGVDEIIEVAAVKFRGGEVLETFQQLVRPRQSLPLKITRLTGITEEELADAPRFSAIAPDLVRFVKSYPLVGHSIGFDLSMLKAQGMTFAQPSYDTFEMATLLMPQAPIYRLSALAENLGIAHPEDHRALNDSDVCRQVFLHLLGRIQALSLNDLNEIVRLTAKANWPLRDLFVEVQQARARMALVEGTAARPTGEERPAQPFTPLKPTGDEGDIDLAAVERFFAPDGPMGSAFEGYEQRAPQVEMSLAVARAFNQKEALLVEAGTGTGKSLSYLTPAAMLAARRGERVVVSTNTINLQDQLYYKDIPALQRLLAQGDTRHETREDATSGAAASTEHLPPSHDAPPFTASILKGRGNYLCLRRYKALRRDDSLPPEEVRMLLKVQLWLPTTQTGDRAELLLVDREQAAWGKVNVTLDTCTGPACPDFRECFFFQARRRAESAHVLVVNHALMLADLATESSVLPPYNHLIIDEAHNLEDVATDQLGFKVDQLALTIFLDSIFQTGGALTVSGLLSELPGHFRESSAPPAAAEKAQQISDTMRPAVERARQAVYDCFNRLSAFMTHEGGQGGSYDPRLRLVRALRQKPAWADVEQAWDNLRLQLTTLGDGLGKLHSLLLDLKDADLMSYDELLTKVEWLKRYCSEVRINIGHVVLGDDEGKITWLSHDRGRDALSLNAAPLSVAELLNAGLFSQKDTVVLASATLSVANSFEFVKGRLGVREPAELQLESPFDYEHQALVFIPTDIPEPNQKGYQQAVEEALIKLCTATGGRTLALFTANSALRQTYAGIQDALEEQEIAVLGQNIDGSRSSLLQRFRESPRTVLLGTTSFWEGVDVVGDALSVLVIPKLPFAVPTDPIYSARSEGFADAFAEYSVPLAILRFKQGFGRLIRSREDRGIVVVLDKRLLSKKYGQHFLHSLPNTTVRTGALKQLPALAARFLV